MILICCVSQSVVQARPSAGLEDRQSLIFFVNSLVSFDSNVDEHLPNQTELKALFDSLCSAAKALLNADGKKKETLVLFQIDSYKSFQQNWLKSSVNELSFAF